MEKKRFFIRQGITLTGLSTASFEKAALACENIYSRMSEQFGEGTLNKWENTTYEGHLASNFNARYFTPRSVAKEECNLPFLDGVDPNSVLAEVRGHDLIHGPDNQVTYLKYIQCKGYDLNLTVIYTI
jgi:hypothetical protein